MIETLHIKNPDKAFNRKFLPLIKRAPETVKRFVVNYGGRGSGKSFALACLVLLLALSSKTRFCYVRKVERTLRDSCFAQLKDVAARLDIYDMFTFSVSPLSVKCATGSEIIFRGMDKVEKIKSLTDINIFLLEEATELTAQDFDGIDMITRGQGERQIICNLNPEYGSYLHALFFNEDNSEKERADTYYLHTTYLDNPHVGGAFAERLEAKQGDARLRDTLGQWVQMRGLIYDNWTLIDKLPDACRQYGYALDFGFTDPCALVKVGLYEGEIYVDEKLYASGLDPEMIVAKLKAVMGSDFGTRELYCDDARPELIEYLRGAGAVARAWNKGKNSVSDGIMLVKAFKVNVTESSVNVRRERAGYKWLDNAQGGFVDGVPADSDDHTLDAIRGYIFTKYKTSGKGEVVSTPRAITKQLQGIV